MIGSPLAHQGMLNAHTCSRCEVLLTPLLDMDVAVCDDSIKFSMHDRLYETLKAVLLCQAHIVVAVQWCTVCAIAELP